MKVETALRRCFGQRSSFHRAAAVATVVAACFATTATAGSSSAAKTPAAGSAGVIGSHQLYKPECEPVKGRRWNYPGDQKISSNLYEMFAINYPCSEAAKWTKRLLRAQIKFKTGGNESVLNGPKGFYCSAWPDTSNHAYAGGCQKRNSPEAFAWNWNVLNRRVVFTPDENGVVHLEKLLGSDAEVVLSAVGDHYKLDVHNTSGVGSIDRFTWTPPPGWTVTKVVKVTGGHCQLDKTTNVIWCGGKIQPPTCLCKGDGAILSIEFTAKAPKETTKNGHPLLFGSAGALLRIKAMTPVPYLIPGTPEAEKQQQKGI
jgi:hypothetical protein